MPTLLIHGQEINYEGQDDFWQSAARGEWEAHSFEVLEQFLSPGMTFIDIGAWNGILSIYALKLGATVIPFEPDPVAFQILEMNLRLNGSYGRARCIAISNENGEKILRNTGEFGNSVSSLVSGGTEVTIVEANTFEDAIHPFIWDSIALIKMDIEGEEVNVIPHMLEWIREQRPTMYISFHPALFPQGLDDGIRLIDWLAPTHRCIAVMDGWKEYSNLQFVEAMSSPHNHSFVFISK